MDQHLFVEMLNVRWKLVKYFLDATCNSRKVEKQTRNNSYYAVFIYCLVMISIDLSETPQKSTGNLRQNPV